MVLSLFKAKLSDLCVQVTDGTHDTPTTQSSGYPLIKGKEITGGVIDFDNCDYIDEAEHLKVIARSKPEKGNTLFAHIGASLGETAYIKTDRAFSIKNIALFKPNPGIVNSRYLYYCIISPNFQDGIKNHRTGSAQPFVGLAQLREFELLYHKDLKIQQRIASILSAYDDLIENNTRRIKILEEMAQRIYKQWFVDFKFPGHEKVKFTNSPLGKIPEGWEVKSLGDLVKTQYGYTESAQEKPIGPKYLRGMDINKEPYIDWSTVPYCPIDSCKFLNYKLNKNDIVIIRMADPGKVGIVEKEVEAVFASYLIRVSPINNRLRPYFLFYFLRSDYYQDYVFGASTGTTRKSASASVITDVDIAIPSRPILDNFEQYVSIIRRKMNILLEQNTNLRRTRDLLLPKLVNGEIEVAGIAKISEQLFEEPVLAQKIETMVKSHKAPEQFKEAVLIAALVRELSSAKFLLSRMRYQKNCYLVLRKAEYDVTHKFLKKAAGPYDHKMRYQGGEKIALEKGYIKSTDATHFVVGENIADIDKYLPHYDFENCIGWAIQHFRYKKNEELELLTTVDYAAVELHSKNDVVTVDSIYNLIESEPKWLQKLKRDIFSKINIQRAMNELKQYFPETYNN